MDKSKEHKIDQYIENIIEKSMVDIMGERFGRYSKYIIQQRAIPDSRDGLKPVQRRILYSMWNLHLKNTSPFKKSARIVGDVIGRFHPHGDSSIYEALVRMCQEWKSNYPLIEMHGNKGSIDDDPAAAMRYTESRLEKISELLLKDLDRKVVDLAPNFDDSEYEPIVLPALFPNLLVNGAKGIAAGFATEIPPHNLNELIDATIKLIKKPTASIEDLMEYVKGPDFPTGGIINGLKGIKQAFETGQGKIYISSQYRYVFDPKNSKKIIGIEFFEIPFGVVKSKLVGDIGTLVALQTISGIKEVRDQSNRDGISIYLELENEANAEAIVTYLMTKTDLRVSYNYNMIAIDENAPKVMNLQSALIAYLMHLRDVNTKGIFYDLERYKIRLEIVEGFIRVAEISDEVIKVIKASDNSKKGVIEALERVFGFTNLQATAIAELRLYKLSRMDQVQFQEEARNLEELIKRCKLLLEDSAEFNKYLIELLKDIKKEYGRERKSIISDEQISTTIDTKSLIKNEDFYIFVTKQGYIKKISKKTFISNLFSSFKLKENDGILHYDFINSLSKILFFTNHGNFFVLDSHVFKENGWKDLGEHVSSYVPLSVNEKIIRVIEIRNFDNYANLLLITKKGLAKRVEFSEFDIKVLSRKRSCLPLNEKEDELVDAKVTNDQKSVLVLLSKGLYYYFETSSIPVAKLSARGVKFSKLTEDTVIQSFVCLDSSQKAIILTNKGQINKMKAANILPVKRTNRPKILFVPAKRLRSDIIASDVITTKLQLIYTNKNNEPTEFNLKNVESCKPGVIMSAPKIKDFNNVGSLVQPVKVNKLDDNENEEVKARRQAKLEKAIDEDLTLTVESALFVKNQNIEESKEKIVANESEDDEDFTLFEVAEKSLETKKPEIKKENMFEETDLTDTDLLEDDHVDTDFTLTDESALDVGEVFKEKNVKEDKRATKESVDKKLKAAELIDLDELLGKLK
ncbi:topoisomerase-4 subunit A [Metamycoplasma subdolum]|uniref:DNA topoisomerase (ATP-hydrolyzing) n=1 Tax=Metamycoplasma subdolum TaxID=92407 RepID=A0A3L9ZYG1_9BACT|nr:DNA topoisomerase IV subunit A [Metamycoplasma subdolum]RMA77486.1 topoisomerase-4 subunit A [Metamycoplasma subdolum]WPB50685.1 DNA topoisomerase IV subunit A [Metamycoplasma subdolum]